ncbi:MAG: chemotaxis protein CheX [Verrucomicrobia bacterium]|jgi:chemotaxis protein CheX|nr:chemotaxis protein CheX [Verrucomicrobiota bacterium]
MAPRITESLVRTAIAKAVHNVFATMLRRDTTPRPAGSEATTPATYQLLASVGFVGEANGVVYLCLQDDFARFATSEVLGLRPGDPTASDHEVVKDAIGEIANMTVGGFKNQLCDVGLPCMLTLPTIVRGSDLKVIGLKGAERHVVEFECAGHVLVADIQVKTG